MARKRKDPTSKDAWGCRLNTGAAAINEVLMRADYPLTKEKIVARVKELGLKERGAIGEHLRSLIRKGYVEKTPHGFIQVGCWLQAEDADNSTLEEVESYVPNNIDNRRTIIRQIRARRGQSQFRNALRERYENRCIVTGSIVLDILEAAHIKPYRGESDNHPSNGLLLRADIHTLFDLNLLGIEPNQLRVELHPEIESEYGHLAGKSLLCPVGNASLARSTEN